MRILLSLIKWFNHLWTVNLTPQEEARQIFKYMLLRNSTAHTIEVYKALKIEMRCEMRKRELAAENTIKDINAVWHKTTEL